MCQRVILRCVAGCEHRLLRPNAASSREHVRATHIARPPRLPPGNPDQSSLTV